MRAKNRSVSLLELIIAISLLSLIVIAFSSIELFSRYQMVSSDRRARVQNEAAYVVEHMAQNITRAIGNRNQFPITNIPSDGIRVRIDSTADGRLDTANDIEIAYRLLTGPNRMNYYSNYPGPSVVISSRISAWTWAVSNNSVFIGVTACDNPGLATCGEPDNPEAIINTRIIMPSVSTN